MVPLKFLCNFWKTLDIPLISGEINFILTWSVNCVIASHTLQYQETTFAITDTDFHVPTITLSTDDNAKLLQQLKSGFKRTISWININQK